MASWDIAKPGDTDIVSQFPANERSARTAFQTNFGINHQSTDGADIGKHTTINLLVQGADPAAVAGQGNLYAKTVSAKAELFWRDSTNAAVQLTNNGKIIDSALSTNVALLNAANTFTALQTINGGAATNVFNLNSTGTSTYMGFQSSAVNKGFIGYGAALGGSTDANSVSLRSEGNLQFLIGSSTKFTIDSSGNFNFGGGTVTTTGASGGVGTAGIVFRATAASDNTTATDGGKGIVFTGGVGQTFTLDSDPPTNAVFTMVNESGNSWTIAGSGGLVFAGASGNRTLANGCMCTAVHRQGAGIWQISGQLT